MTEGIIPTAFKEPITIAENNYDYRTERMLKQLQQEIVAEIKKLVDTIPNFGDLPHDCISRHSMKNLLLGTESEAGK